MPGGLSGAVPCNGPGAGGVSPRVAWPPAGGSRGPHKHALTFHSSIKSSGYGLTFPKARLGHAPPKPRGVEVHGRQGPGLLSAHRGREAAYPSDGGPPVAVGDSRAVLRDACTALHVSVDGSRVVAGSSTGQLAVLGADLTGCASACPPTLDWWAGIGCAVQVRTVRGRTRCGGHACEYLCLVAMARLGCSGGHCVRGRCNRLGGVMLHCCDGLVRWSYEHAVHARTQ